MCFLFLLVCFILFVLMCCWFGVACYLLLVVFVLCVVFVFVVVVVLLCCYVFVCIVRVVLLCSSALARRASNGEERCGSCARCRRETLRQTPSATTQHQI